jgi:hypothetical protein
MAAHDEPAGSLETPVTATRLLARKFDAASLIFALPPAPLQQRFHSCALLACSWLIRVIGPKVLDVSVRARVEAGHVS